MGIRCIKYTIVHTLMSKQIMRVKDTNFNWCVHVTLYESLSSMEIVLLQLLPSIGSNYKLHSAVKVYSRDV